MPSRTVCSSWSRPVAPDEVERQGVVADQSADQRHDAEQHVSAGSGDADELRHRGLAPLVRIAHGTAEADDGIEGVVVKAVEVGDVRYDPVDDAILEPCFG